jgi:hypothetical protein
VILRLRTSAGALAAGALDEVCASAVAAPKYNATANKRIGRANLMASPSSFS